jgi:hypothetical protein
METVKRISEIAPCDLPLLEHVFGRSLSALGDGELVLRLPVATASAEIRSESDDVPEWCNVLEGFSESDLSDFDAVLEMPVRLAQR